MTSITDLPPLDDHRAVDPDTVAAFARDGHACVRGLAAPDEVEAFRASLHDTALANAHEKRPLEERGTYGRAFLQIPNLWRLDPIAARFTLAARFAGVAAQLLGVPSVRLYHDQALFKEAGGGRTPWHQDQPYWPLDTAGALTMWMPLVDVPVEVGSMTFASGSHRDGALGPLIPNDESDRVFQSMIGERGFDLHTYGAMVAGDTTWHNGWTVHKAPANPSGGMRAVMTVIYFADPATVTAPSSRYQEQDLFWLGGRQPGEAADSELNPRLWPPA